MDEATTVDVCSECKILNELGCLIKSDAVHFVYCLRVSEEIQAKSLPVQAIGPIVEDSSIRTPQATTIERRKGPNNPFESYSENGRLTVVEGSLGPPWELRRLQGGLAREK